MALPVPKRPDRPGFPLASVLFAFLFAGPNEEMLQPREVKSPLRDLSEVRVEAL